VKYTWDTPQLSSKETVSLVTLPSTNPTPHRCHSSFKNCDVSRASPIRTRQECGTICCTAATHVASLKTTSAGRSRSSARTNSQEGKLCATTTQGVYASLSITFSLPRVSPLRVSRSSTSVSLVAFAEAIAAFDATVLALDASSRMLGNRRLRHILLTFNFIGLTSSRRFFSDRFKAL
jgi:hypothetical protein